MLPLSAQMGSVTVLARDGAQPVPDPPLSKYDAQFATLPEIRHIHRPEHQQPHTIVPLTAVAILMAVLLAWLGLLPRFAPRRVAPGSKTASAAGFVVLLIATLAFAVWYWLRMTLLDALLPMAPLAVSMVLVGHTALANLASARIASESKVSKSD